MRKERTLRNLCLTVLAAIFSFLIAMPATAQRQTKRPERKPGGIVDATVMPTRGARSPRMVAAEAMPERLFGALIACDDWSYNDKKYGLYELNPATGEYSPKVLIPEIGDGDGGAVYADGKFYVSVLKEFYGNFNSVKLIIVDTETGDKTVYEPEQTYANAAVNMTYDAVNNIIYSINYDATGYKYTLSTFDPDTKTYTVLCPLDDSFYGMCADGNGNLYVINNYGDVCLLDKTTGKTSDPIVETGLSPQYSQSCCWSPIDNKIYWAACNYYNSEIIAIDPVAKTQKTISEFKKGEEWIGLYSTDPYVSKAAPAAPTNLMLRYAAPGLLAAEISCSVPNTTVGGDEMTGTVGVKVYVDGVMVAEADGVSVGSTFTKTIGMEQGQHKVSIACANSDGEGLPANIKTFAGEDKPSGVSALAAEVDATGKASLSWKAPTTGTNGGWFDPAKISYNVMRNGNAVAESITATQFSEQLSTDTLSSYRYSVATLYDGTVCHSDTANTLTFGKYVPLPYVQVFDDESSFAMLTVVNNNNDDVTWKFDTNGSAVYTYSSANAADDYLVFPRMCLKANHVYRITMDALAGSASFPEKMSIVFGNKPEAAALTTEVMSTVDVTENNDPKAIDVTFVPTENLDGHFAVHCTSNADQFSLNIDNVKIVEVGTTDSPQAPEDLIVTPDANGKQQASISFKAPSKNFLGNDIAKISKVELWRNQKLQKTYTDVAAGQLLTYEDKNADFGFNTYSAMAYSGENKGAVAEKTVFLGIYTLPFNVEPSQLEFSLFTVEDMNNDEHTWFYDQSDSSLKYIYSSRNDADDYVITPPVELGTANLIDVEFDAKAGMTGKEKVAVTYGTSPSAANQKVAKVFEISNKEYETYKASFDVAEHGRYYVGFHVISEADQMTLNIKNIHIENGSLVKAPAEATAAKATAAAEGALNSSISFCAPTKAIDGTELKGKVDITVRRKDGTLVGEGKALAPGAAVSYNDMEAKQGMNEYTITTANEFGTGHQTKVSCFCGIDVPGEVGELTAIPSPEDNLTATISWTAPVAGEHNGYFSAADITYNIYEYANSKLTKLGTSKTNSFKAEPLSDVLGNYYFIVAAETVAGEGKQKGVITVLGKPLQLPFEDNFYNSVPANEPWVTGTVEGAAKWGVTSFLRSLNLTAEDGGMLVCYDDNGKRGIGRMQMPKVCLGGLNAPTLTFSMYRYVGAESSLSVKVTSDEVNYKEVMAQPVGSEKDGWQEMKINLSEFKDCPWIAVEFDGTVTKFQEYVILDNFKIENESEYDARITAMSGYRQPVAGKANPYKVSVINHGKQAVKFNVEFGVNGNVVETQTEENPIASGRTQSYVFNFNPTAEMIGKESTISVNVVPDGWTDEVPADNSFEATVTVMQPVLAPVTDLNAAPATNGTMLEWTEPVIENKPVIDDFEAYDSFEYEHIGDYTLYDGDKLTPCGIFGVNHPNMGKPMAFQVWEPKAPGVDVDASIWQPYSGQKCLVSWAALSQMYVPFNDDWLISPEVDGGTELSFYATMSVAQYSPETFEVLYSERTNDPEDFQLLASEALIYPGWKNFKYTLPTGARYFAIRYTSSNKFALLVDDLSYVRSLGDEKPVVSGYNIFRNGEKIGNTTAATTSFTDSSNEGGKYNVTVVYNSGESIMSNTVEIVPSAIAGTEASILKVSAGKGCIIVSGAAGQTVKIYATDGSAIASIANANSRETISANQGTYIVTVGKRHFKVMVK